MKVVKTDIFPFTFCIAEVSEKEKIKEAFVDVDGADIEIPDNASGLTVRALLRDSKVACSLCIVDKKYANVGTAGHEANHLADDLLENIGVLRCPQTAEVYSYVIGFITQKIYETIWE